MSFLDHDPIMRRTTEVVARKQVQAGSDGANVGLKAGRRDGNERLRRGKIMDEQDQKQQQQQQKQKQKQKQIHKQRTRVEEKEQAKQEVGKE